MQVNFFFCVFLTVLGKCSLTRAEGLVVKTSLGSVMGRHIKSYEGRTVAAFEGIPYAKPPVNELRFKEPQPIDPWPETLIANKTYMCMQYTAIVPMKASKGEENCLYLYVYVPREMINGDEKLDVVIHIHGGAFIIGDPKSFAGPEYLMDRDVILVTMNYRLGILGFLSTEDQVVSGNNGLKDQVLAMQWVKNNIKSFGGNPNSITLTGMSAGAACVHFHYLSPLSKGLFHRGLSQSGTALNPWALTKTPLKNAKKLGKLFGCNTESSQEMIDCLREVPGKNLTIAFSNFLAYGNGLPSNPFAPMIERPAPGAFLSDHPYKLLTEGRFNDCPWITSNTKDEGIAPVGFFVLFKKLQDIDRRWNELLPYSLMYYDTVDDDSKNFVAEMLREKYLYNESLSMDNADRFTKLHTDRLFLVDAEKAVRWQATMGKSPVYYYYFDHYIDMPVIYKANLTAVAHGDDCRLLFYQQYNSKILSENDHKMKEVFVDFLYNYATKGVPNFKNVEWRPVSAKREEINYLHVSSPEEIRMDAAKEIGAMSFWDSLPIKENSRLFLYLYVYEAAMIVKTEHPQLGKWQRMLCAKNVYDTLLPLYKISKIMGLSPYAYKEKKGHYQYVISKRGTSYSVLFIIFYIGFFSYSSSYHKKNLESTNTSSKVAHFIDTFQWYASISAMISLVLANCCQQKTLLKAIGKLVSIDLQIECYGLKINHYQAKKEVIITVVWQITAFVIMECLNCSLFLTEMRITSAVCYILCYIPLLISGFIKSQFVVLIALLRYRFETINGKLKTLTRSKKKLKSSKINPLLFVQPKSSQQIVSTIKKLHGELCDVGRRINKAFSLQILCIIGYNFISFTAHAYFCMESYISCYVEKERINFGLITTTMWAVVKLSVLLHLTYACTQTKNEAIESGVIIHKIHTRYQRATLDEITSFSKQILHWDFKFTAFGLFEIDMSTFYLMVTSATTYLIILVQMDMAVNLNHNFLSSNVTFHRNG